MRILREIIIIVQSQCLLNPCIVRPWAQSSLHLTQVCYLYLWVYYCFLCKFISVIYFFLKRDRHPSRCWRRNQGQTIQVPPLTEVRLIFIGFLKTSGRMLAFLDFKNYQTIVLQINPRQSNLLHFKCKYKSTSCHKFSSF